MTKNCSFSELRALLEDRPGLTMPQIAQAMGVHGKRMTAALQYHMTRSLIFKAGIQGRYRYFLSEQEAAAAHPGLLAERPLRKAQQKLNKLLRHRAKVAERAALRVPKYAALDTELLRLADGPTGVGVEPPLLGYPIGTMRDRCGRLRILGLLFSGTAGKRTVRYFRSQEKADAWASKNRTADSIKAEINANKPKGMALSPDAPVIHREVKVQVLPCRIGERWQVKPQGVIGDWMRL